MKTMVLSHYDRPLEVNDLEPDQETRWPFYRPARFYNILELWHSIENVKRHGDYVMLTHDPPHFEQEVYP